MTASHKARRSAEEQLKVESHLIDVFERRITFNQVLGLKVESCDAASPRARFDMKPDLVGHFDSGRLHGGVTASVLDAMGGFALMCAIGEKHNDENAVQAAVRFGKVGTIDLRIDYLRPGLGRYFIANAKITRMGGRVGSVQMTLENDEGVLISTGCGSYIVS